MYKYEMDPTRTVGATERTRDAGQTDGETNGRSETNIPPNNFVVIINKEFFWGVSENFSSNHRLTIQCSGKKLWFQGLSHPTFQKKGGLFKKKKKTLVVPFQGGNHMIMGRQGPFFKKGTNPTKQAPGPQGPNLANQVQF